MTALALRSLRHRPTAAVATFLAALLGTALTASFGTLVESALSTHDDDRELLIIMGSIVGGWAALIVLFSVASTVGIVAGQRTREAGLLRTIGATPRQVRALIVYEAGVVVLLAASAGAVVASVGGPALFGALQRGDLVTPASTYAGGPASLSSAAGVVVLVGTVAAGIASRRATRGAAAFSLRQVDVPEHRLHRWRILVGVLLVAVGLASAVATVTVTGKADDAYAAMQTSGSASIVVGVGLATLAPGLLRLLATPLRPLLAMSGSGHLAAANTTRRAHLLAGALAPVIVLVSTAVGTLLMIGIDERTLTAAGDPEGVGGTITMINFVVIGMICLFTAIMVVNASVAVVAHRRPELDRLWRLGATAAQLRSSIVLEAAVVAVIGILLGLLGSTATAVPYSIVRHEGVVPDGQLWLPPLIAVAAAVLTVGAAWGAQRRSAR
ncbi:FtsX-like permease family protein [Catellatospora sichuanensis]|uniref:FtsX-like permease family protein n=1 Tax=Catellatospora sichuanensis TaxID=1969805 RepID=UPI0011835BB0|nr:FtsX-like permease family protein [Catellatospora sichuanensis]